MASGGGSFAGGRMARHGGCGDEDGGIGALAAGGLGGGLRGLPAASEAMAPLGLRRQRTESGQFALAAWACDIDINDDGDDLEVRQELLAAIDSDSDDDEEGRGSSSSRRCSASPRDRPRSEWRHLIFTRAPCAALVAVGFLLLIWPATRQVQRSSLNHRVQFGEMPFRFNWGCGIQDDSTDYLTNRPDILSTANVASVGDCALACLRDSRCMAWSYGKPGSPVIAGICYLKALDQGELPRTRPNPLVVSGSLPCNPGAIQPPGSLFCFALMLPSGYEQELLAMQASLGHGLFACEGRAVYSNAVVEVAPGVTTSIVDSNLKCDVGGEFKTALNLDIFIAVWRKVFADNVFSQFDWTVKVDPDSVFFPDRLRPMMAHHMPDQLKGVYLNNCKFGMHGPIEVFSRNAVITWNAGIDACLGHFNELCSGPCNWGEDMFIDQCMQKVLGARRDNEWGLLSEAHCKLDEFHKNDWKECSDGHAAFHPFKTEGDFKVCLQKAGASITPPTPPPTSPPTTTTRPTTPPPSTTTLRAASTSIVTTSTTGVRTSEAPAPRGKAHSNEMEMIIAAQATSDNSPAAK